MVLTLYHDKHKPYKVFNCIKVTLDILQTLTVTIKQCTIIEKKIFKIGVDYQRLTIQVD